MLMLHYLEMESLGKLLSGRCRGIGVDIGAMENAWCLLSAACISSDRN